MNILLQRCAALVTAAAVASAVGAAPCTVQSAPTLTPLVELYTSEGCDSCPPADRWLSKQFSAPSGAAVLAFHVDYWNSSAWNDRFSSHAYSERQQQVADANHASFVYTPQVVLQGKSIQDWAQGVVPRVTALHAQPAVANITLRTDAKGNDVTVDATSQVADPTLRDSAKLYVALTVDGVETTVKGGENRGVTLHHDHVVREISGGTPIDKNGHAEVSMHIVRPAEGRAPTVVAFVQDPARGDVLQAVTLSVDRCER